MVDQAKGTALPPVLDASALADAEAFDVVVVGFGMAGGWETVSEMEASLGLPAPRRGVLLRAPGGSQRRRI